MLHPSELYQKIKKIVVPHDWVEGLAMGSVVYAIVLVGYQSYDFGNQLRQDAQESRKVLDELNINGRPYRLVEHRHPAEQSPESLPCLVLEIGYRGQGIANHHTFQNPSESRDITFTLTDGPIFPVKNGRIESIELQR